MDTTVHASIDEETKNNAAAVLREIGLSASDAIPLMLLRTAAENVLPFDPFVPNEETIKAMEAARRGELLHVGGVDELMADLDADD